MENRGQRKKIFIQQILGVHLYVAGSLWGQTDEPDKHCPRLHGIRHRGHFRINGVRTMQEERCGQVHTAADRTEGHVAAAFSSLFLAD